MRYKAARKLGPEDAAYLAGLIDGEGTVTLSRRHANERRQLVLSISSTEPDLLHWAATATGVGKITRKRGVSDKHSPGLTYCVTNRQALAVLAQVAPYLRSYKKRRAGLALEQYVALTPRNGKYTVAATEARLLFERVFLMIVPATRVRPNPFT
jgi:hypothetical protein